jgi:hypothetical protein
VRIKGSTLLTTEEVERAKSLSAMGYSIRRIARELKRSFGAVRRVLTSSAQVVGEVQTMKRNLADSFEGLAERMVDSITSEEIKKLDAYKRTLSAAISVDKFKLLRNEPTAILGVEMLLQIAGELRRESADDDVPGQAERTITLLPAPAVVERTLPAPIAETIPAPIPVQSRADHPPAPQEPTVRIKYTPVLPGKHPDHLAPENPLLTGLRIR